MGQRIKLPNFLCVGVEKCGTTTLYDLLKQHPDIGLSSNKETHFFNTHWDKGLEWYQNKFAHLPDNCHVIGEITPSYHRYPQAIPRIQQTLGPHTKIIILLREPRQRAFSHYIHDFAQHQEITDLIYKRYLTTTQYAPIIQSYLQAFGKNNCIVLIFEEDILPNQQSLMDTLCDFLEIAHFNATPVHSNPSCLPVICHSPDYTSHIFFGKKFLVVPPNSLVIYTGEMAQTRVLNSPDTEETKKRIHIIQQAISFIPALKSSIVFTQNVQDDLLQVEQLMGRCLDVWRKPLGDLQARFAPQPVFVPA